MFATMLSFLLTGPIPIIEAGPPPTVEPEGIYRVHLIQQGEEFLGVCTVKKGPEGYFLFWQFDNGDRAQGVGLKDGNRLWVSWGKAGNLGICCYRIELDKGNPTLVGERGTTERLTYLTGIK